MLFRILLILISTLNFQHVWTMEGGGDYTAKDFAFMVKVKNEGTDVCVGVIDTELVVITASQCLKRVPIKPPDYGTSTTTTTVKPVHQHVATMFTPKDVISVGRVEPGKPIDAPSDGISKFPVPATVIGDLNVPGIKVYALHESGEVKGSHPNYAPWTNMTNREEFEEFEKNQVTGTVVGMSKAATMKLMTKEACDDRLRSYPELYDFMDSVEQNEDKRDHFCAVKGDKDADYPVGHSCGKDDLGAPFVFNSSVLGLLMGSYCDATNMTSLFRRNVRTWRVRRFDGSPTDRPDTTLENRTKTTPFIRTSHPDSGASQMYLFGPIFMLTIVAAIVIRKLEHSELLI
ncbi:hypothetical protein GE061_004831 [Apolygus lucorum]|uniref:Peptidase S1 domain-containing protein n=1 Tax=Apolygus lucorum TaxID=248454 RepID=A0A8S9X0A8_APOLU|nr:hypothetical protein GE061_004831 [Apolygus lucorum]